MEYTLWCDESLSKGIYFSDFYGGILVKSTHLHEVRSRLTNRREASEMSQELKWTKITSHYVDVYKSMVDELFDILKEGKAKIRIMFRQSAIQPINISQEQRKKGFHLLYYQFIKHAFGLKYSNTSTNPVHLRAYFDRLPDTREKNQLFKEHIHSLQNQSWLKAANIRIRPEDITEIDSKNHIEL